MWKKSAGVYQPISFLQAYDVRKELGKSCLITLSIILKISF
jgi:hypothetical protein